MKTKNITIIIIALSSILLVSCSNRPMSMAGFMNDSSIYYTNVQLTKGTLIDTTIEDEDSFDYVSYRELPFNISAATSYNTKIEGFKIGGRFGINGLSLESGYLNEYVGMMSWINAQFGIPCYGGQIALKSINTTSNGFGPVLYYSKNEVFKTEGESLSFGMVDISRGYSYNEVGAGFYYIHYLDTGRSILVDFKIGKNVDINTYRAYFDISYAIND